MKFTKDSVARFKMPEGKSDHIEFDDNMPGFGLRIRAGAEGQHRSFIAQYKIGQTTRRVTIGNAAKVTLEAARVKAKEIFSEVALGDDPQADKRSARDALTLGKLITSYLEAAKQHQRPTTYRGTEHHLNRLCQPLHRIPISAVSRAVIAERLRSIAKDNGAVSSNRARAALSAMFAWSIGEGVFAHDNPVSGTNKQKENGPRERSLSDAELAKLWLSLADSDYGRIIKLLLLTGCRRDEIGSLQWSEIDFESKTITLPRERCKNNQAHVVPLSDATMKILQEIPRCDHDFVFGRRDTGFGGWSRAKRLLDATLDLAEWTVHDLRRTVRTGLGMLGVAPHIAEACINHLPAKLIRTYDKNKYEAEKRDALERWANHVAVAITQATGDNVVKLETA
jgi:integrase